VLRQVFYFGCTENDYHFVAISGNMMPRKVEPVHPSVLMAQQLLTRVGDYTAIEENEDLYANIKSLAEMLVTVGMQAKQ
jgi:hypothetical protein